MENLKLRELCDLLKAAWGKFLSYKWIFILSVVWGAIQGRNARGRQGLVGIAQCICMSDNKSSDNKSHLHTITCSKNDDDASGKKKIWGNIKWETQYQMY